MGMLLRKAKNAVPFVEYIKNEKCKAPEDSKMY